MSSLPTTQKQVHLLARPGIKPITDEILGVVEAPVPQPDSLKDGQVLVKTLFLSLDPSMRPSMNPDRKSYRPPAPLNAPFWAGAVSEVIASKHTDYKKGDKILSSSLGVQEYSNVDVVEAQKGGYFYKIDPTQIPDEREALGALWGTGLAAYLGIVEVAKVKKGDRVLISGAAGATGGLAIQICRLLGASYIIGVAGGPEKAKYVVEELGADECIDYREADYIRKITKLSDRPEGGMDVYFDNVGGDTLDAALLAMNPSGRIACCGAISAYSAGSAGLKNTTAIVSRRLSLLGYIAISNFWPTETFQAAVKQLGTWLGQGKIHTRFHFHDQVGVEHFREALVALFEGKNQGKMLLQVDRNWSGKGSKTASKL